MAAPSEEELRRMAEEEEEELHLLSEDWTLISPPHNKKIDWIVATAKPVHYPIDFFVICQARKPCHCKVGH